MPEDFSAIALDPLFGVFYRVFLLPVLLVRAYGQAPEAYPDPGAVQIEIMHQNPLETAV